MEFSWLGDIIHTFSAVTDVQRRVRLALDWVVEGGTRATRANAFHGWSRRSFPLRRWRRAMAESEHGMRLAAGTAHAGRGEGKMQSSTHRGC